jgi:murein DD-endopeptidase MepM/ murein hydrolase activator NlpD
LKTTNLTPEAGASKATVFILIILIFGAFIFAWKVLSNQAPEIKLAASIKAIGRSTPVQFHVVDPNHGIKSVTLEIEQNGQTYSIPYSSVKGLYRPHKGWRFWQKSGADWSVSAKVGISSAPALKNGEATLRLSAVNDSWGRFFRGGQSELDLKLPVRLTAPQIEVMTTQAYVNQGGAGLVVYKVSPADAESGVEVGNNYFPSWPLKSFDTGTHLCLFAFPYDENPNTPIRVVARDDAGNQAVASFNYKVFPKEFKKSTIPLDDAFMNRVVPAIMGQTPQLQDQGSLLKNFLQINGKLRQMDAEKLIELSKQTAPEFLWTQPFVELPSKVEAAFADYRTYVYNGEVVDHQTHLGFDLAGTQHMPVEAANDGVVVMAQYFGIFGNAILIDHGCGLQSLYGHMQSFEVKVGDHVKRGQIIGHTDTTGLAGGDHLHFTMLVDGVPVNPIEWWDPHWIRDKIESQLGSAH